MGAQRERERERERKLLNVSYGTEMEKPMVSMGRYRA